jgi:hypothetical protein
MKSKICQEALACVENPESPSWIRINPLQSLDIRVERCPVCSRTEAQLQPFDVMYISDRYSRNTPSDLNFYSSKQFSLICVCRGRLQKFKSLSVAHRDPCVQSFRKIQIEYGIDLGLHTSIQARSYC